MRFASRYPTSLLLRLLAIASLLYLLQLSWHLRVPSGLSITSKPPRPTPSGKECPLLPGLEDILVVLKTGASEASLKLPVLFNTTLRCVPNFAIYSDYEEVIAGHELHDALDEVDENIKSTNPTFRVYNEQYEKGGKAIDTIETIKLKEASNIASGKPSNPYWALDKWKFLPMVDKAIRHRPSAKWYVFMEADSYLMWAGLVVWLSHFNPSKPHYIGNQMQIGDVIFAYGGSGYIVSNPAARKVSEDRRARLAEYDAYTESQWAGDEVLGWAMENVNVSLLWAWPNLQGGQPRGLDYSTESWSKRLWCHYPVSYHHMDDEQIKAMWQFEQNWARNHSSPPLHSDVFLAYIQPQIEEKPDREDWDNLSEEHASDDDAPTSYEECRKACELKASCKQYSYSSKEKCRTSKAIRLGHRSPPATGLSPSSARFKRGSSTFEEARIRSGWILDRVRKFENEQEACKGDGWVVK